MKTLISKLLGIHGPHGMLQGGDTATAVELDFQADARRYHTKADMADTDQEFQAIYEQCAPFTMTSPERMYSLYKATEYVVKANLAGDFVECGVWRGGSAMICALTLMQFGSTDRKLYLYDTYEGLPKPHEEYDVDLWSNRGIDGWNLHQRKDVDHNDWAYASLEEVRRNMLSTGYPQENLVFVKGLVEETIPQVMPSNIALLRLDTDWYESTHHELVHMFPKLAASGVLVIDDYGHWMGAKKAVDAYFAENNIPMLLNRIDYSGRMGIKIS